MKIVIAGAGDIGFHLAQLLAMEQQDIILIDTNDDVLQYAATHLDVITIKGDASSVEVLRRAEVETAGLVIAVTTSEKTNLVTAILAKKMGARQTIARVNNQEYLEPDQRRNFHELGIDSLISPRQLAAQEIARLVNQCSLTDIFDFEEGKISLIGISLDENAAIANHTVMEVAAMHPNVIFRPIAILRGNETIIPRGATLLKRNDHIYFITPKNRINDVVRIAGKQDVKVKNVMIVGGTDVGYKTAELLEQEYNVTLVECSKSRCKLLAENLHNTLIINGEPSNMDLLREEGLENMDAFIAVTENSETNILTSLMAKNHGIKKTIAAVENIAYTHISQNIGVDTLINKKLIAANNIFRFVRKGKIEAITSLHGVEAEVIEFAITKSNRLTRTAIRDLHFPKKALIGGVIRGNDSIIPNGEFMLQVDDKVIVFAQPEAIPKVEELFR